VTPKRPSGLHTPDPRSPDYIGTYLPPPPYLVRIVSDGQAGADRAALDWAISKGIAHGGWCPRGRKAEDGPLDEAYQLRETESGSYPQRTGSTCRTATAHLSSTKVISMAARSRPFASLNN
jgi:hypothetical protein